MADDTHGTAPQTEDSRGSDTAFSQNDRYVTPLTAPSMSTIIKDDGRRRAYLHVLVHADDDNTLPHDVSPPSTSCTSVTCTRKKAAMCFAAAAVAVTVLVLAVVALVPDGVCHPWDAPAAPLPDLTYLGTALTDAEKAAAPPFIVQMHGDSLMKNPVDLGYPFFSRVAEHLPGYPVQLVRYADYAKRMDMVAGMINSSRAAPHRAVIILSDTDVTNVDWAQVNATTAARYRARYESAVRWIIHAARHDGTHLAFSSPGSLLSEAYGVFAPDTPRFSAPTKRKQTEYRGILQVRELPRLELRSLALRGLKSRHPNPIFLQALTAEHGVPFIDLSAPFATEVAPWRLVYRGCVTRDGEHANAHGATIMARLYAQQIQAWMYEDAVAARRGSTVNFSGAGAEKDDHDEDENENTPHGTRWPSRIRKQARSKLDSEYAGERARLRGGHGERRNRAAGKASLTGKT